jgi:hypothetical protein
MPEDTSHANAAEEVDISLPSTVAPVIDVAPVNNSSPTQTPSPEATASETTSVTQAVEKVDVGGVDNNADYAAAKAAYLRGDPPANAPAAPGTQATPAQPAETQLPKVPIRPVNQEDMDVLQDFKKNGNGMGLKEFILSKSAPPPPPIHAPAAGDDTQAAQPTFSSLADIDAEIQRLVDVEFEHLENFDPASAKAAREKGNQLQRYRSEFAVAEVNANRVQTTAAEMVWHEDLSRAQRLFADAGVENTPLEQAAAQVRQQWIDEGHPLANDPRSAVALYSEAALLLNQPAARQSAAPQQLSTPPTSIHRPPSIIAGGDARSQPAARTVPITVENYEEMKAAFMAAGRR